MLNEVANDATSASSAGRPTGEQLLDSYLRWTEGATAKLGTVLEPDTVNDLIYTQHYWALRAAPADTVRLLGQVYSELGGRRLMLTDLAEELRQEVRHWQGSESVTIVPDTNIFLQKDKPFEEIDWRSLADPRPEARIVVPIIVVHELDRLKRQGNSTTAQSARRSLRWLADNLPMRNQRVLLLSGTPEVRLECYVHDGPTRPDDADALIIQVCRRIAQISGMLTKLLTYDLGMRIRASAVELTVEQLPDA